MALVGRRTMALRSLPAAATAPEPQHGAAHRRGGGSHRVLHPRPPRTQRRQRRLGLLPALFPLLGGGPELLEAALDFRQALHHVLKVLNVLPRR